MRLICLLLLLTLGCTTFRGGGESDEFEGRGDVLYSQDCSVAIDADGSLAIEPMPESDRPCRVVKGGQLSDNATGILSLPMRLLGLLGL